MQLKPGLQSWTADLQLCVYELHDIDTAQAGFTTRRYICTPIDFSFVTGSSLGDGLHKGHTSWLAKRQQPACDLVIMLK